MLTHTHIHSSHYLYYFTFFPQIKYLSIYIKSQAPSQQAEWGDKARRATDGDKGLPGNAY